MGDVFIDMKIILANTKSNYKKDLELIASLRNYYNDNYVTVMLCASSIENRLLFYNGIIWELNKKKNTKV